jgi:centromeric protein E
MEKAAEKGGSRSITVGVRFRPMNDREMKMNASVNPWRFSPTQVDNIQMDEQWQFDHVFDEKATTKEVYEKAAKNVVTAALDGFNGTIFAYGQTGSGKTHTMYGDHQRDGIMPLTVHDIFKNLDDAAMSGYTVSGSFMEIYNEEVFDLFQSPPAMIKLMDSRDQSSLHTPNLQRVRFTDAAKLLKTAQEADKQRHIAATKQNNRSSRSHAIFRLELEIPGPDGMKRSELNLVDLAGSEGTSKSGTTGVARSEGANINKSLLALSTIIKQISEGITVTSFRESKLTRLLQFAIAGNSVTSLVLAASPTNQSQQETKSSLEFGQRAKKVKTALKRNVTQDPNEIIKSLKKQMAEKDAKVKELQDENVALKEAGVAADAPPTSGLSAEVLAELESLREQKLVLEAALESEGARATATVQALEAERDTLRTQVQRRTPDQQCRVTL